MTKQQVDRIRKEYGDEYLYRQLAEECMELGHAALNDMLDADERVWLMVQTATKNQRMVARLLGGE